MKFRDLAGAFRIVLGMVVGVWLYANFGPQPDPEYREVRVPTEVLVKQEPDTIVRWRERIVYRTVAAEQRAVADSGAVPTVQAFCRPSVLLAVGDTARPVGDPALVRSATYDEPLLWGRATLKLWEARSSGDLAAETFRIAPNWRFAMGETAVVQGSRFWWARPLLRAAIPLAVGYGLGKL